MEGGKWPRRVTFVVRDTPLFCVGRKSVGRSVVVVVDLIDMYYTTFCPNLVPFEAAFIVFSTHATTNSDVDDDRDIVQLVFLFFFLLFEKSAAAACWTGPPWAHERVSFRVFLLRTGIGNENFLFSSPFPSIVLL